MHTTNIRLVHSVPTIQIHTRLTGELVRKLDRLRALHPSFRTRSSLVAFALERGLKELLKEQPPTTYPDIGV